MYIAYTSQYIASAPEYLTGRKYFLHTCRKASSLFYIGRRFVERSSLHLEHGRVMRWLLPLSQSGLIYRGADILFTTQGTADPVRLLQEYTNLWDYRHAREALFIREDRTLPNKVWFDENFLSLLDDHSVHAGVLFNVSIVACPLTVKLNGVESYYIVEVPVSLRSESWSQIDSAGYTNECR